MGRNRVRARSQNNTKRHSTLCWSLALPAKTEAGREGAARSTRGRVRSPEGGRGGDWRLSAESRYGGKDVVGEGADHCTRRRVCSPAVRGGDF
jgi:hypothetical protein